MPPIRRGVVEKRRRADGRVYFRGRVRLADGSRERADIPAKHSTPAGGKSARERAELYVQMLQEHEDTTGERLARKRAREALGAETFDDWFARYLKTKDCGESYRRITSHVVAKWVSPAIGAKPVRGLTRDDVEDVRDRLDRALDAKEIRHSTARNVWSALVAALKAAYAARDRSLRVLSSPLHFGILPPKRGETRQRPWIYPREWEAFVECAEVPVAFRQVCAIALYTGLRPGELRALTWADVDLEARTISVSKAFDPQTRAAKRPKTAAGQRTVPIHENLMPLLEAAEGDPDDLVLGSFNASEDHMASNFRMYLAAAGVDRPRLTADNAAEEPVDFRSLRDTHATWLALAHVPDRVIQRRLGHASPTTTDRYVKVAETFATEHVGVPFPSLPASFGPPFGPPCENTPETPGKLVARGRFASWTTCFSGPSGS
jgi:integrase